MLNALKRLIAQVTGEATDTAHVSLKGGQVLTFRGVKNWKLETNAANEIVKLNWEVTEGTRVPYIRLDDVSAIVVKKE